MHPKIIDYILLADSAGRMESRMPQIVLSWIKLGWQPLGGPCHNQSNGTIYQAMVKYEEPVGETKEDLYD